jgi:hypothetical protein
MGTNKLECLLVSKSFQASLTFVIKATAALLEHLIVSILLALLTNAHLGHERDEHAIPFNDEEKVLQYRHIRPR